MKRYYQRRTGRTSWCPGWCRPGCWSAGRHRWRCPATACWCWSRGRRTCYRISRHQWSAAGRHLLSGCPGLPSCNMWNPCCQRQKQTYLPFITFIFIKPYYTETSFTWFWWDHTIFGQTKHNSTDFLEFHCTRTWNTTSNTSITLLLRFCSFLQKAFRNEYWLLKSILLYVGIFFL